MSQWSWKETWTEQLQWKEKGKSRMTTKEDPIGEDVKRRDSRHELDGRHGKLQRDWLRQVAPWRERALVSEDVLLSDVFLERVSPSWRRSVVASMVIRCSPRDDDTMPRRLGDRRRT